MYRAEIGESDMFRSYESEEFEDDRWFDALLWAKDRIARMKPDEMINIIKY